MQYMCNMCTYRIYACTHIYKFLAFVVYFLGYSTSLLGLLNPRRQWILSQFWRSEAQIKVKVELSCSGALDAPPSVCIWVLIPSSYKETNHVALSLTPVTLFLIKPVSRACWSSGFPAIHLSSFQTSVPVSNSFTFIPCPHELFIYYSLIEASKIWLLLTFFWMGCLQLL